MAYMSGKTKDEICQARQRERLNDFLGRPNWSPSESRFLLSGLDPEHSTSTDKDAWWLLPGTTRALENEEMQDRLERVEGLGLTTMSPEAVLEAALSAPIHVPWLSTAAHDRRYRLPKMLRKLVLEREAKEAAKKDLVQRRNRDTAERQAKYRAGTIEYAEGVIARLKSEGYPLWSGRPNMSEIVKEIKKGAPLEFNGRTIKGWIDKGLLKL
ncbi:hypothetical protein VQ045_12190 [Aurantimonas sp. E1-2-R+4]|uniref:hypothetical protein n=1 Tax=Aurantimonas sp. E1-2-R+4 TaxID=3113714 RepID=UPI002F94CFDA